MKSSLMALIAIGVCATGCGQGVSVAPKATNAHPNSSDGRIDNEKLFETDGIWQTHDGNALQSVSLPREATTFLAADVDTRGLICASWAAPGGADMGWSVNHGESWNDVNTVTLEGLDSAVSISSWVHIIDGHCAVLVGAALGSTTSVGVLAEDMNHAWSRVAVPTIGDFDRMGSSIAIASYPVSQAVAVSRDNGADWEFSSLKFDDRVVNVVFFRPRWHLPNSLEAAVSVEMSISPSAHRFAGGLADSSDGGKTWKPILLDGAVSDDVMVGDVDDSGDLALAGHGMAWTAMIVSGSLEPVASVELPGDARPVSISAGSPVLVRTVPGACHDVRSCRVSVSKLDADGRSVALVGSM